MSADREKFLSRWSRLKREVKGQSPDQESPPGNQPPAPRVADPDTPQPKLPPLDQLTLDSDYRDFFHPKVDEKVRLAALKKLFSDPHFNVMDGLDVYIDDYSKPDPLPAAALATLRQAQKILEWAKETKEETEAKRAAAAADPLPVSLPDQAASTAVGVEQPPAVAVEPPPVEQVQDAEQQ
ncbi:MAG: hypothetical protein A3G24_02460 [Betaproteobacteria bacterium RIFCSPLOWO2_12_FULL_62_13]|nr:MAG: hypothetical protein A3G24_02460 [Betaproteobacteria bacterium RIFCSPLOWO2_12_FULL_62_13]